MVEMNVISVPDDWRVQDAHLSDEIKDRWIVQFVHCPMPGAWAEADRFVVAEGDTMQTALNNACKDLHKLIKA